jgi:hypothetical protein
MRNLLTCTNKTNYLRERTVAETREKQISGFVPGNLPTVITPPYYLPVVYHLNFQQLQAGLTLDEKILYRFLIMKSRLLFLIFTHLGNFSFRSRTNSAPKEILLKNGAEIAGISSYELGLSLHSPDFYQVLIKIIFKANS